MARENQAQLIGQMDVIKCAALEDIENGEMVLSWVAENSSSPHTILRDIQDRTQTSEYSTMG